MGRNLDLDNCTNKQAAVIAAYEQEMDENERKIANGAWATSLDMSRISFWYPILMRYCPQHPLTQDIKWERELLKSRKDLAQFFAWSWD